MMKRHLLILLFCHLSFYSFSQDSLKENKSDFYNKSLSFRFAFDNIGWNFLSQYEYGLETNKKYSLTAEAGIGWYFFDHEQYKSSTTKSFVFSPGFRISNYKTSKVREEITWNIDFRLSTMIGEMFDWYTETKRFRFGFAPNISGGFCYNFQKDAYINCSVRYGLLIRNIYKPKSGDFFNFNRYVTDYSQSYLLLGLALGFRF